MALCPIRNILTSGSKLSQPNSFNLMQTVFIISIIFPALHLGAQFLVWIGISNIILEYLAESNGSD